MYYSHVEPDQIETDFKPKKPRIPGKRIEVVRTLSPDNKILITDPIIKLIGQIADENNYKVFIVGGYVRDYYLKRKRFDYDFTVVGDSIAFAELVAKKLKVKCVVFQRFKTAHFQYGDFQCEFVGTRKEMYEAESRNPIVSDGTLEDDLRRRDFTINAMAASVNIETFGNVIDLFQSKKDIQARLLRTPLDPITTFNDDPLRMLRAARFGAQINFAIDGKAIKAAKKLRERIEIISQERITEELLKILASPKPSKGLYYLLEMGLLELIFPEIFNLSGIDFVKDNDREYGHKDIMVHSFKVLDNVATKTNNIWLRFASLVHDIGKPKVKRFIPKQSWTFHGHEEVGARMLDSIFRKMKFPMHHLDYVEKIVRLHHRPMSLVDDGVTDSAVRRLAFQAGDILDDLFLFVKSDITTNNPDLSEKYLKNYDIVLQKVKEVQEKDKLREFQSPVRGEEIMELCNLRPSYAVGFIKNAIEEAILDGIIPNDYEQAKQYFLKHKDNWLQQVGVKNN